MYQICKNARLGLGPIQKCKIQQLLHLLLHKLVQFGMKMRTIKLQREIIVRNHDGHSHRIQYYYGCYDPLQYLLLFPEGEPGWHRGISKKKGRQ